MNDYATNRKLIRYALDDLKIIQQANVGNPVTTSRLTILTTLATLRARLESVLASLPEDKE